jgi:hypothetical protein
MALRYSSSCVRGHFFSAEKRTGVGLLVLDAMLSEERSTMCARLVVQQDIASRIRIVGWIQRRSAGRTSLYVVDNRAKVALVISRTRLARSC